MRFLGKCCNAFISASIPPSEIWLWPTYESEISPPQTGPGNGESSSKAEKLNSHAAPMTVLLIFLFSLSV